MEPFRDVIWTICSLAQCRFFFFFLSRLPNTIVRAFLVCLPDLLSRSLQFLFQYMPRISFVTTITFWNFLIWVPSRDAFLKSVPQIIVLGDQFSQILKILWNQSLFHKIGRDFRKPNSNTFWNLMDYSPNTLRTLLNKTISEVTYIRMNLTF